MTPGLICKDCGGAKREPTYRDAVLAAGLHSDLSKCSDVAPVENLSELLKQKEEGEA